MPLIELRAVELLFWFRFRFCFSFRIKWLEFVIVVLFAHPTPIAELALSADRKLWPVSNDIYPHRQRIITYFVLIEIYFAPDALLASIKTPCSQHALRERVYIFLKAAMFSNELERKIKQDSRFGYYADLFCLSQ